jgi:hypothetical protein
VDIYRVFPNIFSKDGCTTSACFKDTQQHTDGSRFARSVGTDEPIDLSRFNAEADIPQCRELTVVFCQIVYLDDSAHGISPLF